GGAERLEHKRGPPAQELGTGKQNQDGKRPGQDGKVVVPSPDGKPVPPGQEAKPAQPKPPAPAQRKPGINENYARELLELHTLGVDGGYTQKDVQEVARCLTGWT